MWHWVPWPLPSGITSSREDEELETVVAAIDEKCTPPSDSAISAVHISESDFSDILSPTPCQAVFSFVGKDIIEFRSYAA